QTPSRVHLRLVVNGRAASSPRYVMIQTRMSVEQIPVIAGYFRVPAAILEGGPITLKFNVGDETITIPGISPERLRWEEWTIRIGSLPEDDVPRSIKADPTTACVVEWETAGSDAVGWVVPDCRRALPGGPR